MLMCSTSERASYAWTTIHPRQGKTVIVFSIPRQGFCRIEHGDQVAHGTVKQTERAGSIAETTVLYAYCVLY